MKVLHFVTGGFSGATQVAVDLVRAHAASGRCDALLVLRRKRHTRNERVQALLDQGLAVETVAGWAHAVTIWQLVSICRRFKPDVLVAHGFSEHLWGRYAGLIAGVPRLVIEAAHGAGWWRTIAEGGAGGDVIGIERFGESAPAGALLARFGFTSAAVLERARALLAATNQARQATNACC